MINLAAAERHWLEVHDQLGELGCQARSGWADMHAQDLLAAAKRGEELRALCEKFLAVWGGAIPIDTVNAETEAVDKIREHLRGAYDAE